MDNPLRQWRKTKGLRAVDVALQLGVSERSILAYETGAFKPTEKNLATLSSKMDVKLDTLKSMWNAWILSFNGKV
jgi:transcriptional regulator with XRE-family HTH domain